MAPIRRLLPATLPLWALLLSSVRAQYTSQNPDPCPLPCQSLDQDGWRVYHDMSELERCQSTVLFKMNIHNDDTNYFKACSATIPESPVPGPGDSTGRIAKRQTSTSALNSASLTSVPLDLLSWDEDKPSSDLAGPARSSIDQLRAYIRENPAEAPVILFARTPEVVAGLYVGGLIDTDGAEHALGAFSALIGQGKVSTRLAAQTCGNSTVINRQFFGVVIDTTADFGQVQQALRSWHDAKCLAGAQSTNKWKGVSVATITDSSIQRVDTEDDPEELHTRSTLVRRDGCEPVHLVIKGDRCSTIQTKYGITQAQFMEYNGLGSPGSSGTGTSTYTKFCNGLQEGQPVCYRPGGLPVPKPDGDGNCASYSVKAGDTCSQIAKKKYITVKTIESNNNQTWAWGGCEKSDDGHSGILIDQNICLSAGKPPIPANDPGATCGPQMNKTDLSPFPSDPSKWSEMNPCPLNACCNRFGQCGINPDFCDKTRGPTGNPGTAPKDKNGCLSNCGTNIITGPVQGDFQHIGYFESFQNERKCFRMPPSSIPNFYTIVHWGFGDIKKGTYEITSGPNTRDWKNFVKEKRFKRVLSLGGWAFSTDEGTYDIFREGVKSANRQTFADQCVKFVKEQGLDGIDFDWEYPGAPDNQGEGIPLGDPRAGLDYYAFLLLVKDGLDKLGGNKILAIAAPASYWYAKAFPMDKIAEVVTYIIYMTYDLHGQWDHGNPWTNQGCPNGNCLRSHVNTTETNWALSMITKAGVPAEKVILGQPLYGRSFRMTDPNCSTPECTFTEQTAKPGRCTNTGGYISNLEIREIERDSKSRFVDIKGAGTVMIYDGDWVSYLSTDEYARRAVTAVLLGLGGTSDWAIDLNITNNGLGGAGDGQASGTFFVDPSIYDPNSEPLSGFPWVNYILPPYVLPRPITIQPDPYTTGVLNGYRVTEPVTSGGTTTSTVYVTYVSTVTTFTVPPLVVSTIDISNVIINSSMESTVLTIKPSIQFPNVTTVQELATVTTGTDDDDTTVIDGISFRWSPPPWPWSTPIISGSTTPSPPPDLSSICPDCDVLTIPWTQGTAKPTCTPLGSPKCGKENRNDDNDGGTQQQDGQDDCINCNDDDGNGGGGIPCPVPPCPLPCIGVCPPPPGSDQNNNIGPDGFPENDRPGDCEERETIAWTVSSCTWNTPNPTATTLSVSCTEKEKDITVCPPGPTPNPTPTTEGYVPAIGTAIPEPADGGTPPDLNDPLYAAFVEDMKKLEAIDNGQDPNDPDPNDPTDPNDPNDPWDPNDPNDPHNDVNNPNNAGRVVEFCLQERRVGLPDETGDYTYVVTTPGNICGIIEEYPSEFGDICDIENKGFPTLEVGSTRCAGSASFVPIDKTGNENDDPTCPFGIKYAGNTFKGEQFYANPKNKCSWGYEGFQDCAGEELGTADIRTGRYYFKKVIC